MKAQATKDPVKSYTSKLTAILDSSCSPQDKISQICDLEPPAGNANALMIWRKARQGKAPQKSDHPYASELAAVVAANKLQRIEMMADDLKNLNFYGFGYELQIQYSRDAAGGHGIEHRKMMRQIDTDEFPTKDGAREKAASWKVQPEWVEDDGGTTFKLEGIAVYSVTHDSRGQYLEYEKAGALLPNGEWKEA